MKLGVQLGIVTAVAAVAIAALNSRAEHPVSLWLTPDQQGRAAYEDRRFPEAADLFENPMWKGTAAYAAGRYTESADAFGRIPTAIGFFNRGNALLKSREYVKAIPSYEQAVAEDPEWPEAAGNLELARYILEYLERIRGQSDTGDESELSADEFKFDNTKELGHEITITNESAIELESAEKWMRSVDTETRDFLRTRFELEARQAERQ